MTDDQLVFLTKCAAMIEEFGLGVIGVPDGMPQRFSYSYGRLMRGLPEILIMGLPERTAQAVINHADAIGIDSPGVSDDLIQELPVRIVHITDPYGLEIMSVAKVLSPVGAVTAALQIVWPDPKARFPGDGGYDQNLYPQAVYGDHA